MTKLYLSIAKENLSLYDKGLSHSKYVLISFFYERSNDIDYQNLFENVIVDSGAFTFLQKNHIEKDDIDNYVNDYIKYINKYDIEHYVEMDIDGVVPYEKVLRIREKLERETGKQCIPIWHHSRGKNEFIKMCKEYKYSGIGGIAGGEELARHRKNYKQLNALARKNGSKLHGMGFTPLDIEKYSFYSVDSTSWKSGGRFGTTYKNDGTRMRSIQIPKGKRIKDYKMLNIYNLKQWIRFQYELDRKR